MTDIKHTWSSNFEHDGMANVVFTRCLEHPDTRPLTSYDWPGTEFLAEHERQHEAELKALEEIQEAN